MGQNNKYYFYFILFFFILISLVIVIILIKKTEKKEKEENIIKNIEKGSKTVLITGGASGIGKSYAKFLLDKGYKVVIIDIKNAKEVSDEFSHKYGKNMVLGIKCDVTNKKQYKNAFEQANKFSKDGIVDILILNAAIYAELFCNTDNLINTNLIAPIYASELYIKQSTGNLQHKSKKEGLIIITSSIAGIRASDMEIIPVYNASKAGINQFVRSMEPITSSYNLRINAVCPGSIVQTGMTKQYFNNTFDTLLMKGMLNIEGRGGVLQPEDINPTMYRFIVDKSLNGDLIVVHPRSDGIPEPDLEKIKNDDGKTELFKDPSYISRKYGAYDFNSSPIVYLSSKHRMNQIKNTNCIWS